MTLCYAFEAKSIQDYVLGSGKLKEMVGASALVDQLVEEPLSRAISAVGLLEEDTIRFSRRAGGSFIALLDSREKAEVLRDLWSLIVPQYAPGLSFVHTVAESDGPKSAASNAMAALRALRFPRPTLPSATPLSRFSPRSGMPASSIVPVAGGGREWVDAAVIRKRAFSSNDGMTELLPEGENYRWPVDMEQDFPFTSDNRYVGIIHADGNGLGKILLELQACSTEQNYVELYYTFSRMLTDATVSAARDAINAVLVPACENSYLPARPLVLGGDDLTMIVRGDLGMKFSISFLDAFERHSRALCAYLKEHTNWDKDQLSACAGIAYIKAHQPFSMAYGLAEELCGMAKNRSGRSVSALSFHAVSTSFIPDADWVMDREMTTGTSDYRLITTMGCYKINNQKSEQFLPQIEHLRLLQRVLGNSGERSGYSLMRRLVGVAHEPPQVAEKVYRRWRSLLAEGDKTGQLMLKQFDESLAAIVGEAVEKLPAGMSTESGDDIVYLSPVGDILALNSVEGV